MQKIITWLARVEQTAERLYRDAASYFKDPDLVEFLRQSAEDEAFHHQIMVEAIKVVKNKPEIAVAVVIDPEIQNPIETALSETQNKLNAHSLSKAEMIECIVTTEYSEWNDIFLYVVNRLKDLHPPFKSAVAKIQHHLRHIEQYLKTDEEGRQRVMAIRELQPVWTERILIIEDDPDITELLAVVMKGEGMIDTAADGRAALEKIRDNYYRLIISDINMPEKDGITLFKEVSEKYPGIERRYLFFSSNPTPEHVALLNERGVNLLLKPARLNRLKNILLETLHSA